MLGQRDEFYKIKGSRRLTALSGYLSQHTISQSPRLGGNHGSMDSVHRGSGDGSVTVDTASAAAAAAAVAAVSSPSSSSSPRSPSPLASSFITDALRRTRSGSNRGGRSFRRRGRGTPSRSARQVVELSVGASGSDSEEASEQQAQPIEHTHPHIAAAGSRAAAERARRRRLRQQQKAETAAAAKHADDDGGSGSGSGGDDTYAPPAITGESQAVLSARDAVQSWRTGGKRGGKGQQRPQQQQQPQWEAHATMKDGDGNEWQQVLDAESGAYYWWCEATQTSSWTAP